MRSLGDAELDGLVERWMRWDRNERTRAEVSALVDAADATALRARMVGRLAFGTAGMRAPMEAGFNRLNDLVIIQTTQGMAAHLRSACPGDLSVVIGFDGRHNSERFARLAANVFVLSGIRVHLFDEMVSTPMVSYGVIKLGCSAGVVITASHNPKEDNGYKAYWTNGAQILAPHDTAIADCAVSNLEPMDGVWDVGALFDSLLLSKPSELFDHYFNDAAALCHHRDVIEKSDFKVVYTPFHGVGQKFTPRLLQKIGFKAENIIDVVEQSAPDADFPTVPFPNPEEGERVWKLAIATADRHGCEFILANDPDADRLQLAEKQPDGAWKIFSGNEMGAILAQWTWQQWKRENDALPPTERIDAADVYFLNSAVSSTIVSTMATLEGFQYEETLTGFKWMGNRADQLRRDGKTVALAWEESIGFMPWQKTLDKDGVVAAALFAECAVYYGSVQRRRLSDQLNQIYTTYGYHLTRSSYFVCRDPAKIDRIFEQLRKWDTNVSGFNYAAKIGDQCVATVRDLTVGYDNSQPDDKPTLPVSKSSQMITFKLANGSVATLRASGTEPKIKYYVELRTAAGKTADDLPQVLEELRQLEKDVSALLRPEQNQLISKDCL